MSSQEATPEVQGAVSLEERIAAETGKREEATTEDFPVPGWDSVVWVRLKVVNHKAQKAIGDRLRRQRVSAQNFDLYVGAELLLAATDGFYEVDQADGETLKESPGSSWNSLCKAAFKTGDELTPRQALIRFIGDERVVPFGNEYGNWLTSERQRIGGENKEDFGRTT